MIAHGGRTFTQACDPGTRSSIESIAEDRTAGGPAGVDEEPAAEGEEGDVVPGDRPEVLVDLSVWLEEALEYVKGVVEGAGGETP